MTAPDATRPPRWAGFGWTLLAVAATFLGLAVASDAALRLLPLWLCADKYTAAELEVTRVGPKPKRSGRAVEGVIHPGGETVQASGIHVDLGRFVPPESAVGHRLEVLYWPGHEAVREGWHPPTVVMPGATDTGGTLARNGSFAAALLAVGVASGRRMWRHVKASAPPGAVDDSPPRWVGIVIVLMFVVGLGLVVYFS